MHCSNLPNEKKISTISYKFLPIYRCTQINFFKVSVLHHVFSHLKRKPCNKATQMNDSNLISNHHHRLARWRMTPPHDDKSNHRARPQTLLRTPLLHLTMNTTIECDRKSHHRTNREQGELASTTKAMNNETKPQMHELQCQWKRSVYLIFCFKRQHFGFKWKTLWPHQLGDRLTS